MSTSPTIEQLIASLWDGQPAVRAQAIAALANIGPSAIPALLQALQQDDHSHEARGFENPDLRRAIVQLGEPMFQALLRALQSDRRLARAVAKTLPLFNDPRAVEPLLNAMHDERISLNSRLYIIDTLGTLRDPRAFQPLVAALTHEERFMRSHTARAIS
jgi:HEAT repeat protein